MTKISKKKRFRIPSLLLFFILCLCLIPLTTGLLDWFGARQLSTFSSSNWLMFIHSPYTLWLFILPPMIFVFCIMSQVYDKPKENAAFYKRPAWIAIIVIIGAGLLIGNDFFYYAHIDTQEIIRRKGVFSKEVRYQISDIETVTVDYKLRRKRRISVYYELHFKDNQVMNLYDSDDFFLRIKRTDEFFTNKGIHIHRRPIEPHHYLRFEHNFKGPGKFDGIDRLEVIESIFGK